MIIDEEYKNKLITMYRTELFATDGIDIKEIDSLISDNDLKAMIQLNNSEMAQMINEKTVEKNEIKKLFIANVNFYKLAKYRKLSCHGKSFLMAVGSVIDYNIDRLYGELNVGEYNSIFKRR